MIEEPEMLDRFVVEANSRTVGIAVRVPGGYRFFASDDEFLEAEAGVFRRTKAMASKIDDIARLRDSRW